MKSNKSNISQKKVKKLKVKQPKAISIPSASSRAAVSTQPNIQSSLLSTRIRHRELIATVTDSGAQPFKVLNRYRVNPGSAQTFPWLSGIALGFETYRFISLRLRYYPRCGTGFSGSYIMSPDYDAADAALSNETDLCQQIGAVEDAPWKEQVLHLKPQIMNRAYKSHFVMSDGRFVTSNQDAKTIDVAQAYSAAVSSEGNNSTWGKLWIEYDVELCTPQKRESEILGGPLDFTPQAVTNQINVAKTASIVDNFIKTSDNVYPTNRIGELIEDFKGTLQTQVSGVGLSNTFNLPGLFKNGTTVLDSSNNIVNSAGTFGLRTWDLDLKKGDVLSWGNPGSMPTSYSVLNNLFASTLSF